MHDRPARHAVIPWIVGLAVSAVIVLPVALKHPRHHYTLGARIVGALLIWIAIAALIRLLVFVVDRLRTRQTSPP
jgi:hypothetical protein